MSDAAPGDLLGGAVTPLNQTVSTGGGQVAAMSDDAPKNKSPGSDKPSPETTQRDESARDEHGAECNDGAGEFVIAEATDAGTKPEGGSVASNSELAQTTAAEDAQAEESDTAESDQRSSQAKKRRRSVEKDVSPAAGAILDARPTAPDRLKVEVNRASTRSPRPKKQKGSRKEEKDQGTPGVAPQEDSSKGKPPSVDQLRINDEGSSSCSDAEAKDRDGSAVDGLRVPPLKIVLPQLSGEKEVINNVTSAPFIYNSPLAASAPQPSSPASSSALETKEQREESKRVTRSSQRAQQHENDEQSDEFLAPTTGRTHPRKRKMRNSRGAAAAAAANQKDTSKASSAESGEKPSTATNVEETQESAPLPELVPTRDYFGEPSTMFNPYRALKNIRHAVEKRRLAQIEAPVKPEAPKHFKKYLMNKCTYALDGSPASRLSVPRFPPPSALTAELKELFQEQEEERYRLRLQHVMEKDKLTLACEQEILRANAQAARAAVGQTIPLSVTAILRDLEIYNTLDPESSLYNPRTGMTASNPLLENHKKDLSRYNGRVFTSWLQDVEDKWERNKEAMLLRHHSETEALRAVQKMDWEWKTKQRLEESLKIPPVDNKTGVRGETHVLDIGICVPMVDVNDDFELLPC